MRLALVGGAYKGRSANASTEDCINLFKEKGGPSGEGVLVNVHGSRLFSQLPAGEVRGMHFFNDYVFAVVESGLYQVDYAGAYTQVATLGSASGQVSMTDNGAVNGRQLVIADGGPLKVYSLATNTLTVTSSQNTNSCAFIDGYVVFAQLNSGQFWWTELYDATDIDGLNFSTAEGKADNIVGIITDRRQLWIPGVETSEVWYNSGAPFTRFQGGFNHTGCVASRTIARFDNAIVWLSRNEQGHGIPVACWDYNPKSLVAEHPQVAYQISKYSRIDDAFAYVYQYEGHEYYVLTFPTANATWVYDASEKEWHRRAHVIDDTFPNRERYNCHCFAFGKHLVGDYSNGRIYQIDSALHTMNGELIPNQRTTEGHRDKDEDRIRVTSLQLTGEEGVGGDVTLEYSKNSGHTWSAALTRSFGDIGSYSHRAIWRKLGIGRDWAFRFTRSVDAKTIYTGLIVKEHGEP